MDRRRWAAAALAVAMGWMALGSAAAQGLAAVRKQVESSMLLTGSIDINADGSVAGHAIDQHDALPPPLREMVARAAQGWRFEPVVLDPGTTVGRARMSLRLVAKDAGDGNLEVRIASASFGSHSAPPRRAEELDAPERARLKRDMRPPRYPEQALHAKAGGTVYLLLKVGRDGRVIDAVAEQTNLRFISSESAMPRWRKLFEDASIAAVRKWQLGEETAALEAGGREYWSARVAIDFVPESDAKRLPHTPGVWEAYVPGPRTVAPWLPAEQAGNDALIAGEIQPVGTGLKLLTPLQPQG